MPMLKGIVYWAKVVGEPQLGYDKKTREWSFDLAIDEATKQELVEAGAEPYIREANEAHDNQEYISFKQREFKQDGNPSKPYRVVDHQGQPWGQALIGNGSAINVKYLLNEVNTGKNKGHFKPSALALQVVKHIPYEGGFPVYETNEQGEVEEW